MELFSKRYGASYAYRRHRPWTSKSSSDREDALIDKHARLRLQEEIKFVIQAKKYVESFLLTEDRENERFILNNKELSDFSSRELGYDLSELIHTGNFSFRECENADMRLFDLIEMLFIFAKTDKRARLIERIRTILLEEKVSFVVHGHMIFPTNTSGLRSIIPLMRDGILKDKLKAYFSAHTREPNDDYVWRAKIASEIIQHLFSSPKGKARTKTKSEALCKKVAKKLTTKAHVGDLTQLISNSVLHAKALNNQIENIRHTDQHTIPVDVPDFYKLVATNNLAIAELVILSLPGDYVSTSDPDLMKEDYLKRYEINKDVVRFIPKKEVFPDMAVEDIPF